MGTKTHHPRLDFNTVAPAVRAHMLGFRKLLDESGVDAGLRELLKIRASQINGCAFCVDMHIHEARKLGISDDRLHMLSVWRETPGFSDAERTALELTEAVTHISKNGVSDALYKAVRDHYTEQQYMGLLTTITVINAWNRLMVGIGAVPAQH